MKKPNEKVSPEFQIELDNKVADLRIRLASQGVSFSDDVLHQMVLLKMFEEANKKLEDFIQASRKVKSDDGNFV